MESRDSRRLVSKQTNLDWFQLECLQMMKNKSFYRVFDRNHPIVLIDGYDDTSTMDHFWKYRGRLILINGPNASARLNVINAWFCRRWIAIRPLRFSLPIFNRDCYNAFNKSTCAWSWSMIRAPRDRRVDFRTPTIRRFASSHVTCIENTVWDLVPHGIN